MYAVRWTITANMDSGTTVPDILKKISKSQGYGGKGRVYMTLFGDSQLIVSEVEFEDAATAAQVADDWLMDRIDVDLDGMGYFDAITGMTVEMYQFERY